ncbi:GNAT family N-acetyltransferase [Halococcus hamelinensis]|uniref:GCN5-related N-acetyltransferase n=1 Tax=Halococcus hamelinensis 100A6 TaxID=1132509 RepID=M0M4Y9_9EURY|nr:GNAT family N-acetyltransferase [Halococcus hamelinensis]EMA40766.1 GCN5-related N-acetyltransferase [Halococcus hamelinensis 100A6]
MNPSVRSATTDDLPGIQRVADAAWRASYGDFLAERTIETILDDWYSTDQLETTIENARTVYLVAETDGEVVGYASAAPTANEEGQLYAIYVDPDHWDGGAGTALLDEVLDRLSDRGVSRLRVEVLGDNTVGVSFYESRGFERTSERNRAVGDRTLPEFVYYRDV